MRTVRAYGRDSDGAVPLMAWPVGAADLSVRASAAPADMPRLVGPVRALLSGSQSETPRPVPAIAVVLRCDPMLAVRPVGHNDVVVHAGEPTLESDHLVRMVKANAIAGVAELVWNSLDAEATRVEVRVHCTDSGAVDQVSVADSGHGFSPDEVEELM